MKIRELFEAPTPLTTLPYDRDDADDRIIKQGGKQLGQSGTFGTAYEVPKDVSTVVKHSRLNKAKWYADGYFNYIERIKNITDNPYLPQIYEVIRVEPKSAKGMALGEPYLLVNIERLYPSDKISADELYLVIQKMIGRDPTEQERYKMTDDGKLYAGRMISQIAEALVAYLIKLKGARLKIRDPQLMQALNIIRKLKKQGYSLDLHEQNFMFRRTPYGPQLVLTDPLAWYYGGKTTDAKQPKVKIQMSKRPNAMPDDHEGG